MQAQTTEIVNGLNTTALSALAETLGGAPDAGRVGFRSHSRWQDGARVFTRVSGYRIDGTLHHEAERAFVQLCDEPVELGASDAAPAPAEQLLHAIASCIIATTNAYAALGGIPLYRLEVALEGDIDLHGIFALDPHVRPGLGEIRATITVAGDAGENTLREVAAQGLRYSPIRDSVENGVTIRHRVVVS